MRIILPLPSIDKINVLGKMNELQYDKDLIVELKTLFSSDTESLSVEYLEIAKDSAVMLANKYDEQFMYLSNSNIDKSSIKELFDLEGVILDKIVNKIVSKMNDIKDSVSDFGKRLTVSIKTDPASDIKSQLSEVQVKRVELSDDNAGFINRSFDAYAKARELKSLNDVFTSISDSDITKQVTELNKVVKYLANFEQGDMTDKEIKEDFLKQFNPVKNDDVSYDVIKNKNFKVPKVMFGLDTAIKDKDVLLVGSAQYNNIYHVVSVGVIKKNFVQNILNIKDFSDRYHFTTLDSKFVITDLTVVIKDVEKFVNDVTKELKWINEEITALYSLKMPVFKGINFPDSSYFDLYNALYVVLFARYQLLMDSLKVADIASK